MLALSSLEEEPPQKKDASQGCEASSTFFITRVELEGQSCSIVSGTAALVMALVQVEI